MVVIHRLRLAGCRDGFWTYDDKKNVLHLPGIEPKSFNLSQSVLETGNFERIALQFCSVIVSDSVGGQERIRLF
jgi:hypothetical protein